MHCTERIRLATAAAKHGELCNVHAGQAFFEVSIDEETCIFKTHGENQTFPGAVGLLKKVYGLVEAGRCWFNKLRYGRTTIGFEQPEADPCVFRKFEDREVGMMVVVHVDDILAHAKNQAAMDDGEVRR